MLNNDLHIARIRQGVTERMMHSKAWSQMLVEDVELVGAKGLTVYTVLECSHYKSCCECLSHIQGFPLEYLLLLICLMNVWLAVETMRKGFQDRCTDIPTMAPNDTAYTQWSCHSGLANSVQIVSTPLSNGCQITAFWASRPCGPVRWRAMLLIKAGDVKREGYRPQSTSGF